MHLPGVVKALIPGATTLEWGIANRGAVTAGLAGAAATYYLAPEAIKYFREKQKRDKSIAEQQADLEAEVGEETALRKKSKEKETDNEEEEEKPKKKGTKVDKKKKKANAETDDEEVEPKKKTKGDAKTQNETAEWSNTTKFSLASIIIVLIAVIVFWLYRMSLVPN